MSRSGYTEDIEDYWRWIMWRGAVASAIRGRRGQAFLREMTEAMDQLPEKRLITGHLENAGEVCALGAVGKKRGLDMSIIDEYDYDTIADKFDITPTLAREIMYLNDEVYYHQSPEDRHRLMRKQIQSLSKE